MTHLKNSFINRLKRLRKLMAHARVDLLIIERPLDLYYLTGLKLSVGRLLIHSKRTALAVDGRYIDVAKKNSPFPVISLTDEKMLSLLEKSEWKEARVIGFDSNAFSYANYLHWRRLLSTSRTKRRLKKALTLKGLSSPVSQLRMIKDKEELKLIEKSAKLLWKGFEHIQKILCEGISEREVAFAFETYCKELGAEALSFDPIIAFGKNSAFPHYVTGKRRLKQGDIVLIDIGLMVDRYASDMTRMLFFGSVPKRLQELFTVVKKAQEAALLKCHPGAKGSDLDLAARRVMAQAGLEKYYLHSLGHGIGLEVHEPPRLSHTRLDVTLEPGMVVSVEPGLYLPGVGGVRYEDSVIITEKGYRNLFPETLP